MKKLQFFGNVHKVLLFFTGSATDSPAKKRARFIVYFVIVILVNVVLGKNLSSTRYPWYANISVFLLLNINIILALLLLVLLLRNIARLMTDRQKNIFGVRLQTKLVIFSVILAACPVLFTYFMSSNIINDSIDRWFDNNVLRTVQLSVSLSDSVMEDEEKKLQKKAEKLSTQFNGRDLFVKQERKYIENILKKYTDMGFFTGAAVYLNNAGIIFSNYSANPPEEYEKSKEFTDIIQGYKRAGFHQNFYWSGAPLIVDKKIQGIIFLVQEINPVIMENREALLGMYDLFSQLRFFSHPVRKAFNVSLFMISMMVIFASIWGSIIFVRSIARPLKILAATAGKISRGKFDARVEIAGNDEISFLGRSFNYMATKLDEHTKELEHKNTELNHALERISKDKLYIDTIYKNVDSALILFDRKLNILKANTVAEALMTKADSELIDKAIEILKEFITGDKSEYINQTSMNFENEEKIFSIHINKIYDHNNKLDNIMLVIDDNTYVINMQRINLWKEVATRIAHEIKNPLTPIKLTAERVKKKGKNLETPLKDFVDSSMDTIITEVDELLNLVEDFNVYARTAGPAKNNVRIGLLLHTVAELHQRTSNIHFSLDIDDTTSIIGDQSQLKRLFTNLIQNAIHAIESDGEITIACRNEGDMVKIIIEDNGIGISAEDIKNIFIPYFSKKPDGTGLGLAIVKKIVEDHNGKITVESNAGTFTRFTILLPMQR